MTGQRDAAAGFVGLAAGRVSDRWRITTIQQGLLLPAYGAGERGLAAGMRVRRLSLDVLPPPSTLVFGDPGAGRSSSFRVGGLRSLRRRRRWTRRTGAPGTPIRSSARSSARGPRDHRGVYRTTDGRNFTSSPEVPMPHPRPSFWPTATAHRPRNTHRGRAFAGTACCGTTGAHASLGRKVPRQLRGTSCPRHEVALKVAGCEVDGNLVWAEDGRRRLFEARDRLSVASALAMPAGRLTCTAGDAVLSTVG